MKFSEQWLREWVDPGIDPDALLEQLTMAGLEVEGVAPVADACTNVVVARVARVEAHPNADKLSVCEVEDGAGVRQVVCGAPNVRAGLVTAFARVGAKLGEELEIRRAKLRGVESHGMLLSAAELGLGDDHDGILELDASLVPGSDIRSALGLDDRTVELKLTPNRGDCLSVCGLAREVGVLNDTPVRAPVVAPVEATHADARTVTLDDPHGCPRYLGRVIRGVDIRRPSPFWLVERLRRAGLRSIDPVVDVTNYVMLELGQPMHAFDLAQIRGGITVRRARPAETLTLLDGREVALDADTLLISDDGGAVAIAGVMGGERSGVQADTADVFLECAYFNPLVIAGTARRYGLNTDASHRYERGVDHGLQPRAMERATRLLLDIVGGEPGPVVEAMNRAHLPVCAEVALREQRLTALLGTPIAAADVDRTFDRLGFERIAREITPEGVRWTIRAPSHRFDIAIEADLVEEVCRIHGYNRIPSRSPTTALELREVPLDRATIAALKQQFVGLGYQEAITYSFVDPRLEDLLSPGVEPLELSNPMSLEQSVMRSSLLPGLVGVLRANVARQQDRVRVFEVGACFQPGPTGLAQPQKIGGLIWGRRTRESWLAGDETVDFFDIKGDVERLLAWAGVAARIARLEDPVLHPGQAAGVWIDDVCAGRFGRLHPEVERSLEVAGETFVLELDADVLLLHARRRYRAVSRFPSVRRDLALVVRREVAAGEIVRVLEQTLGKILVDLRLFDLYQGKGIDSTEKSIAVGLTLQDASATLTEVEIGRYVETAVEALAQAVGARLR